MFFQMENLSETKPLPALLLASQSPRRKQILDSLGLKFTARKPNIQEEHPHSLNLEKILVENARKKALDVAGFVTSKTDVVVAADTLVLIGEQVAGKPKSIEEAREMLTTFSANTQTVMSGLVLFSPVFGERCSTERTQVHFYKLSPHEIEEYLKTKEPYDKAGGYAIQGLGALFVERVVGSYTNVMGFPIELFLRELFELTKIPLYRWFQ